MDPDLRELLRRSLVLGGPMADLAMKIISEQYPLYEVNFMYPYDMKNDPVLLSCYRKAS